VVGYGSASKQQVQAMVRALLGLAEPPDPPDVADALALSLCHLASGGLRGRLDRHGGAQRGRVAALDRAIGAALQRPPTTRRGAR